MTRKMIQCAIDSVKICSGAAALHAACYLLSSKHGTYNHAPQWSWSCLSKTNSLVGITSSSALTLQQTIYIYIYALQAALLLQRLRSQAAQMPCWRSSPVMHCDISKFNPVYVAAHLMRDTGSTCLYGAAATDASIVIYKHL